MIERNMTEKKQNSNELQDCIIIDLTMEEEEVEMILKKESKNEIIEEDLMDMAVRATNEIGMNEESELELSDISSDDELELRSENESMNNDYYELMIRGR